MDLRSSSPNTVEFMRPTPDIPLLDYIKENHPYWIFLNRYERIQLLAVILPNLQLALNDHPPVKRCLFDTYPSLATHATVLINDYPNTTVFNQARSDLGSDPNLDFPLIMSGGGELHVMELLVVCHSVGKRPR